LDYHSDACPLRIGDVEAEVGLNDA
jgi:hypothetical protein